ncbi:putative ABC-type multidrug transport system, ATPase and permease component [Modestobacter italicus]|uniref:ABC-type multidrug transport system, ATPase and permease component n=1 Tax=Modestobacter italicus (strain DSM 44449 / CECT 9708 / BC 501) TaxID=2732864 RepID=I4EZL4_MODI5|nr:ABC transporter ATP-binding protein [Modestobacter marinus]CCH88827.1 putative ABC-type multidrug transport system, ATPase and permease component [Modestobacter marinus]
MTAPEEQPLLPMDRGAESATATLRRGLRMMPEFRRGLPLTLLLALVATAGRVVVPIAVQQTLDRGLGAPGGPDIGLVRELVAICAVVVLVTAVAVYRMNVRLFRTTETALAGLRVRAFRHVHDLSVLHQQGQRRGSLVSRVTSDVDQLSVFMQWGGVLGLVSLGQLVVATVVMAVYSWQLTLLVLVCFIPLAFAVKFFARRLATVYGVVRERIGEVLAAVGESVVGAPTVRAYGIRARTAARLDRAIDRHYRASVDAQKTTAAVYVSGEFVAAVANAAVVVVGVWLGIGGQISAGTLVAFLFLVTLFVAPVQTASEVLNEAQNAVAGFRRVLDVLDTEPDVQDPAVADPEHARELPPGPLDVRFDHVGFGYAPGARKALDDVDLTIAPRTRVAIVGETGSGKTTFAKLVTRLMDPTEGRVLVGGVPLTEVAFASLRERVVMVPQDGFLFDASIADNVRYGRPGLTDDEITAAFDGLGLGDWLGGLSDGVRTPVGQRGESLSAGERQLVAVARAYVADPDLLVLDEATSAVDPATEMRLTRALDALTDGRTTLTIAHRLSTAERADEVLVVDAGRVVQRGTHAELVDAPGPYAGLHASWRRSSGRQPEPVV